MSSDDVIIFYFSKREDLSTLIFTAPPNSPCSRFFRELLSKRKLLINSSTNHCRIYEVTDEDYALAEFTNFIPSDSEAWTEALKRLRQGADFTDLLDILEIGVLAERLK